MGQETTGEASGLTAFCKSIATPTFTLLHSGLQCMGNMHSMPHILGETSGPQHTEQLQHVGSRGHSDVKKQEQEELSQQQDTVKDKRVTPVCMAIQVRVTKCMKHIQASRKYL